MRSSAREALEASETQQRDSASTNRDSLMSRKVSEGMWDPVKQKANIMASFVPDEVLKTSTVERDIQAIQCCVLYGRVSGLNKLVTKYIHQGTECISELSDIINKLLGRMVQEMLAYGGDVLKFGVNSLVAIWKSDGDNMSNHVHLALDCAIVISKYCNSYIDEKEFPLSVRLAVAAGDLLVTYVENDNHIHMIVFGSMIEDMKDVRKKNHTDDIISSAVSLKYVYAHEYIVDQLEDATFFKISGLSPAWRQVARMSYIEDITPDNESSSSSSTRTVYNVENRMLFSLRPITMTFDFENKMIQKMKKCLKKTIARSIEFEEPLQNLTEIRHILLASACIRTNDINVWNSLDIGQETVKIFQRNAAKYYGAIHNVEFFNKEIFVLIVFGLRGFKQSMECKNCLLVCSKSSSEIRSRFSDLESISVGVCRGKSFCTTVGHSLRRDYVLMGSTHVRAELLAVTYVNKLTCDEMVFLHSKLGHDFFKLQEKHEQYSKFFPESVYEFVHDETLEPTVFTKYAHPTVGNDTNVALFKEHLQKWLHASDYTAENIFLIKGFAKEGKTRLLHDMISNTEPGVPVNYFKLRIGDDEKPFHMLVNLFAAPLGWTPKMKTNQKKKILKKFMPEVKGLKKLKAVYEVFQLVSPARKITRPRLKMVKECLVVLCHECFKTPWLIAIDDVNFMDSKSWDAIQPLLETNLFFLLMTCQRGYQIQKTETYEKHIGPVLRLKGLQKEFLATYACQVMKVYAIPADLEFALHKKSNGNPGWISNLLVFLLEIGKLVISEVPYLALPSFGWVCPPFCSIFRLSKQEINKIDAITGGCLASREYTKTVDLWNVVSDTWGDSKDQDILTRKAISEVHLKSENCRVALFLEPLSIESLDKEETRDVFIAQILDSLTYNELIFLKCCSILGLTFLRDVLYFVNPGSVHYEFAEIVQKMFEKQILVCAGGDFTERPSLLRNKMMDPANVELIACNCRSLIIEDRHRHLPKYASCGYLRFKSTSLRTIVYNSLNREQRIEFHSKAITYLQEQLKKCVSCGGGRFNIGPPNQTALMKKKKKKKKEKKDKKIDFIPTDYMSDRQLPMYLDDSNRASLWSSLSYRISKSLSSGSAAIQSSYFDIYGSNFTQENLLFSSVVQHYKNRKELTRTFSYTDFSYCECDEILSDYYYQMILHYNGKEQLLPMFQNMIDYVKICLLFENISEATRITGEAQKVIEKIFEREDLQQWKRPLYEAKLYNLQAQILLYHRHYDEALTLLLSAMKKFNRPLPNTNVLRLLKLKWNKWRVLISGILYEDSLDNEISLEQYLYYCDMSDTLGLLCDIYTEMQNFSLAELTAMWSLIKALKAKANSTKIYLAYERVLHVYEYLPSPKTKILLETMALLQCHKKKDQIEFEEFRAITKLYCTLSRIRFQLAEIASATELAYITVKMFYTQRFNKPFRSVLIVLSTYLIWGCLFQESAQILSELDIYSSERGDVEGRIWYYCQAMYFHLQLGYTIASYQQCKNFCVEYSVRYRPLENNIGLHRLNTLMWLWCTRNERWEEAQSYMADINKTIQLASGVNPGFLHSALFVTEGYLLYLVHKLDQMNIFDIPDIIARIHKLFSILDEYSKMYIVVEPMVLILKAYYLHIQSKDTECFKIIAESLKMSRKHQNYYHERFAEHLNKAFRKELPPDVVTFWKDHSSEDNLLEYVILVEEEDQYIGFFTYPTPKYISEGILAGDSNWKKLMKLKKIFLT